MEAPREKEAKQELCFPLGSAIFLLCEREFTLNPFQKDRLKKDKDKMFVSGWGGRFELHWGVEIEGNEKTYYVFKCTNAKCVVKGYWIENSIGSFKKQYVESHNHDKKGLCVFYH